MPRKGTKQVIGQVTLYQRGRTWQASYTTPELGRKRVSLKVTNLKEAQKKAKEIDEPARRIRYAERAKESAADDVRGVHHGVRAEIQELGR